MLDFPSDFAFLGERDYIHAPMLFETLRVGLLRAAGRAKGEIAVRSFRVNRPVKANMLVRVRPAARPGPGGAFAEFNGTLDGDGWIASLHPADCGAIVRREPSLEKEMVGAIDRLGDGLSGRVDLCRLVDNYTLIQAVAEANKQFLLAGLPPRPSGIPPKFRFVYCLGFRCPAELAASEARLEIRHGGMRRAGEYVYCLNALTLSIADWRQDFQLCYASLDLDHLSDRVD